MTALELIKCSKQTKKTVIAPYVRTFLSYHKYNDKDKLSINRGRGRKKERAGDDEKQRKGRALECLITDKPIV